ncbi:MAG: ABC-F family ATP-binding cassette domain-containing protein [Pseudomonadota bacterium]
MSAPILFLDNIHLTFGGTPLLEGADLAIHPSDRICLVGRNGSGKSTLMKIAAGLVEPDQGQRFQQPGTTLHYLPQEPDLANHKTVADYIEAGLGPQDDPHKARLLAEELGIPGELNTSRLSGGESRRAALVRALAKNPEILFLDEPTNHLDLPAIEWLEQKLEAMRSAIVMISHDRRFLEKLSRKTVWMDRGQSRTMNSGFARFEEWRDETLEQEETDRHKLTRKIVREEHWITHGVSGRRKRNMRRVRELADLRKKKAGERKVEGGVNITMAEGESSGKLVLKLFGISKSFDEQPIVKDLSLIISRGDRLGIVGPNGSGKTTLIKLITGELETDAGKIKRGVNLDTLLIDQKREVLDPAWTLKDALTDGRGDTVVIGEETKYVYTYMKDFLFLPEQAKTPIHALSGGERARLALARGLRTPSNLLILDEPTNDLDLETLDLLQEFLSEYPGTVLLVSHDRDFLDRVCTSVLVSQSEGVWREYAGGYTDMLAQRGLEAQHRKHVDKEKPKPRKPLPLAEKANTPQQEKLSFKQKHALETLPKEIERLEFEIGRLQSALAKPGLYEDDPRKFNTWAEELAKREKLLAEKEESWLELELLAEEITKS